MNMAITPRKIKQYGWHPDLPDFRDHVYSAAGPTLLPTKVDLTTNCPEIYNQGALGSCTANAIGAVYEFVQKKETPDFFMPSRLFIYYNERDMEGTVKVDAGAKIRDGMKVVANLGVCPETEWPYKISKFASKPSVKNYTSASKHKVLSYKRITQSLSQMKTCIAEGYPFVFGFAVYESFESNAVAKSGIVPMPTKDEKSLGGHAVTCVGYDDDKGCFLIRNSWGKDWGIDGHCWMPYAYVTHGSLASDFWTIRQTNASNAPIAKVIKLTFWQKVKNFFFPPMRPFNS
jgi:C1A family cysteine protease